MGRVLKTRKKPPVLTDSSFKFFVLVDGLQWFSFGLLVFLVFLLDLDFLVFLLVWIFEAFGFSKVWLVFRLDLDSLPFLIQICNGFGAFGNLIDKHTPPSDKWIIYPTKGSIIKGFNSVLKIAYTDFLRLQKCKLLQK